MRHSILSPVVTVLILLLAAAFVAGCGGGESPTATATPEPAEATEEPPPTPTSGSQATEQPAPTAASGAAAESGLSSDVQRYIDTNCTLTQYERDPETWGEVAEWFEEQFERIRRNRPPEELREYFEASLAFYDLIAEFFKSKDPAERFDPDDPDLFEFSQSPEFRALQKVRVDMDPDLATAVSDAGCE